MRVMLECVAGPHAGRQLEGQPGRVIQFGRSGADWPIPEDEFLSRRHFEVSCEIGACWLRDLNSSNGTRVNGRRVQETALRDKDRIEAGESGFVVQVTDLEEDKELTVDLARPRSRAASDLRSTRLMVDGEEASRALVEVLRRKSEPVYALVDAAQDPRILPLLKESGDRFQALRRNLALHLVELSANSPLLDTLPRPGGVYLTSTAAFADLKHHLGRLPHSRTLGDYLRTCTPDEYRQCFGPVRRYLAEGAQPGSWLEFEPEQLEAQRAGR